MTDGILFFNSQRLVSFTLTAVFLLIWLPVNLRIAQMMTGNLQSQTLIYKLLYTTATLSAAIFLLAKTPLAVSLSFTAISVSFLSLVVSNFYAERMGVGHAR
ncbi:MAG TPA: hypothetical protein VLG37_05440 [Candidatus Saccharimonadales bacterium]|nr:hypothetical protein [Candidatus Saccharimonadales bacterium]